MRVQNKMKFFSLMLFCLMQIIGACDQEIHLPQGRHVVADLISCQQCYYSDDIEDVLKQAVIQAGATILDIKIITFSSVLVDGEMVQGMTGAVILSESHITFHTWPEHHFVACDIFTCGDNALPEKALEVICNYFKPVEVQVQILNRGLVN